MARAKYGMTIGAHVPKAMIPKLDSLCGAAKMSRSRFVSLIVLRWYLDGCPRMDKIDERWLDRALKLGELPEIQAPLTMAAEEPAPYLTQPPDERGA
jgi:hypothetical protein